MARPRTLAQQKKDPTGSKRRQAFLAALSQSPNITRACRLSGLARRTAYERRNSDSEFAKAWDGALELGIDALEDEVTRRAHEGVKRPVYQGGKRVGEVREYSDTLAMFTLKGRRLGRWRDNPKVALAGVTLETLVLESIRLEEQERLKAIEPEPKVIEHDALQRRGLNSKRD